MKSKHDHPNREATIARIHDLTVQIRGITGTHTLMQGGPKLVSLLSGPTISAGKLKQVQAIALQIEAIIGGYVSVTWGSDVYDPTLPFEAPRTGAAGLSSSTTAGRPIPPACPICEPKEYIA